MHQTKAGDNETNKISQPYPQSFGVRSETLQAALDASNLSPGLQSTDEGDKGGLGGGCVTLDCSLPDGGDAGEDGLQRLGSSRHLQRTTEHTGGGAW